jgi:uncharacterized membrane protein SirB2
VVALARWWHAVTALVAMAALVLQLWLIVTGAAVLAEDDPPGLALRLGRFVSYFTVQSNLLVAVAAVQLWRRPDRDGRWFRVLRLAGAIGITVTGLVHFVLLRPLLDLAGASWMADRMLHVAVPLLAVVGWVAFGPRPRVDRATVAVAFAWPLAWLAWTLVVGASTGWFPYPFLDFDEKGWASVSVACAGVTALFLALVVGAGALDRRPQGAMSRDAP